MNAIYDATIAVIAPEDVRRPRGRPRACGRRRARQAAAHPGGEGGSCVVRGRERRDPRGARGALAAVRFTDPMSSRTPTAARTPRVPRAPGARSAGATQAVAGTGGPLPAPDRRSAPAPGDRSPARPGAGAPGRRGARGGRPRGGLRGLRHRRARSRVPPAPRGHHPPAGGRQGHRRGADRRGHPHGVALSGRSGLERGGPRADADHAGHRADVARKSGGTLFEIDDLATPQVNIAYGAYYLRYLLNRFGGDEGPRARGLQRRRGQRGPLGEGGDATR